MAIIKIKNQAIDLDAAEIPNLPATKITSGTFDNARISLDAAEIPNLDTAKITTGTLADARLPANALNSNIDLTNLSASNLTSGTVATARLGSGTADATTFLRGDNTFDTPPLGGITMVDQWRPNAMISGNSQIYTSEWIRISGDSPGYFGSAMTQSSGVFTFPSTGKYWIQFRATLKNSGSSLYIGSNIEVTENNSSWSNASIAYSSVHDTNAYQTNVCSLLFNCSNTSTHKVRFGQAGNQSGTVTLVGGTGSNESEVTFIRLGD